MMTRPDLLETMRAVIAEEESAGVVYDDVRLCDRCRVRDVWCNPLDVRRTREANGIPDMSKRRGEYLRRRRK